MTAFTDIYGPFFTYDEFVCHCGSCETDRPLWYAEPEFSSFMETLMNIRRDLDFPFRITSGYRCPDYNDQLYIDRAIEAEPGKHRDGPHTKGAADIGVSFERAYKLINAASHMGLGIGIHQRGKVAGRYVHLDDLGPRIWTY